MLYVDDGSTDDTWQVMQRLARQDPRVSLLRLSRNFGKELALTAGLDQVEAGAVLILDADGQDPPELIPQFVAKWREGYDDVHGTRIQREGENWLKRATAAGFYRVIGRLSKTPIPADTGDFRLLSPRALQALGQLRERHRFMKGLFGWVGFQPGRDSLSARSAPGRQQQVRILEIVELRPGRHHQLFHRAACAWRPTWAWRPRPSPSCSRSGSWSRPHSTATAWRAGRR